VRHWQRSVQHELFEYEGRISQLVRLVEYDVPQAIGILAKIVRRLEEYQAVRAEEPRAAYNELALIQEVWTDGESASADPAEGEDASVGADSSAGAEIESGGGSDA
jgi:hypothetical protein